MTKYPWIYIQTKEELRDFMRAYHIRKHYSSLKRKRYRPAYYEVIDAQRRER